MPPKKQETCKLRKADCQASAKCQWDAGQCSQRTTGKSVCKLRKAECESRADCEWIVGKRCFKLNSNKNEAIISTDKPVKSTVLKPVKSTVQKPIKDSDIDLLIIQTGYTNRLVDDAYKRHLEGEFDFSVADLVFVADKRKITHVKGFGLWPKTRIRALITATAAATGKIIDGIVAIQRASAFGPLKVSEIPYVVGNLKNIHYCELYGNANDVKHFRFNDGKQNIRVAFVEVASESG